MSADSNEKESNVNLSGKRSDAPEPTFIDEIGPLDVIPLIITRVNARELLGRRPGETVAQALVRMVKQG
ncbi:pirin [Burkholderia pseudomallei]|nr:pirin [Burkholderia multivorans]ONA17134.1 pirin [Burkholderia pseudomallei]